MVGVKDDTGFRKLLTNRKVRSMCARFIPVACLVFIICLLVLSAVVPTCAQGPSSAGSGAVPLRDDPNKQMDRISNRAYTDKLDQPVVQIKVDGNVTIPESAILRKLRTQLDRRPSQKMIQEDIQRLYRTRWFFNVSTRIERTNDGLILTFIVKERPIVDKIEYRGNDQIKDAVLADITGLRPGSPYDTSANIESVQRLKNYYKEKGYYFADVKLISGDKPEQRDVIFQINERYKTRVQKIDIDGNEFVVDGVLKMKLSTKKAVLWKFGGLYDPSTIQNDLNAITQYYTNFGFFDVKVDHRVEFNDEKSSVYIYYTIKEGKRYKIRRRIIRGNEVFSEEQLTEEMELGESDFFNARILGKDVRNLKVKYGEQGRFFATVDASPVFLESPGEADLLYTINEDKVYTIRNIDVRILGDYPHTKETVAYNILRVAPGDLADPKLIRLSESRLGGSQIFERTGIGAPKISVHPVTPADGGALDPGFFRGQSEDSVFSNEEFERLKERHLPFEQLLPDDAFAPTETAIPEQSSYKTLERPRLETSTSYNSNRNAPNLLASNDFGHSGVPAAVSQEVFRPRNDQDLQTIPVVTRTVRTGNQSRIEQEVDAIFRGQSPPSDVPPFVDPNIEQSQYRQPYNPMFGGSPLGDPLGPPPAVGELDINVDVTEARTGRFMFGVGVNSDSGVAGNIVLEEQNFDILNFPTSFQDIINGTAWRGDGQKFRLEAVPGSEIGRYTASWSDPYFLDTDYSFGVSGFYFTRFYPDWDEQRTGGRLTLGKQLTPEWSVAGSFRLEDITIDDPSIPTPQELQDALGNSLLTTLKGAVTHDTRDTPFMPGEGHIIEANYEQAFGDYSFPKVGLEASQYFTVFSRPDGGGRQIISLAGQLGWTGSDTPIFEQFYAGGFQTFRGFAFRGVGPVENGVNTGGEFMALGSVEYIFPLMANETVQAVAFSDFGTVEDDVSFEHFRLSIGGGLRVTVPAMGPVPLAFDWAYPLIQEDFDDKRVFSFYVGFTR